MDLLVILKRELTDAIKERYAMDERNNVSMDEMSAADRRIEGLRTHIADRVLCLADDELLKLEAYIQAKGINKQIERIKKMKDMSSGTTAEVFGKKLLELYEEYYKLMKVVR